MQLLEMGVSFEAALTALPKHPPFMEPFSFAVATVPITAAMINGQLSAGAAARTAFEVAQIDESFGLWFVHGHGHRESWHLHADALALSANAAAVLRSHVLLFSTDVTGTTAFMVRAMAHYPQRVRVLMHSGANTGYRCGLLHSLSATEHVWRRYAWVVFTHPDVYLLPPAPMLLSHVLSPALATSAPFPDGAPGSAGRHAALLATPTRMFWYGQRRPIAYLSDLFAFRPALLRAAPRTCCGTISANPDLLWDHLGPSRTISDLLWDHLGIEQYLGQAPAVGQSERHVQLRSQAGGRPPDAQARDGARNPAGELQRVRGRAARRARKALPARRLRFRVGRVALPQHERGCGGT